MVTVTTPRLDTFARAVARELQRRERGGRGMTQGELADRIGALVGQKVYQQEISRWLGGGAGLRVDKAAAALRILRLVVVPASRARRGVRGEGGGGR